MERTLNTERLYSLGDFKNIKFSNTLNNIPEEIAENQKAVGLMFYQQALSCEIAYRRYYDMIEKINEEMSTVRGGRKVVDNEKVMEFLLEERQQTMKELYEELKKNHEKETE